MNLKLFIAFRYLFSKKSYNIINIISMICAGGICVATIALVCTLSVYNGFQQLITGVISSFDPDLKITIKEGKTFDPTAPMDSLKTLSCVSVISEVLEENALIRNKEKQTSVTIKGVSANYGNQIPTDSLTESGRFVLSDDRGVYTVLGAALALQIEADLSFITPISFYAPKYATKVNLSNPEKSFNVQHVYVGGIYATHQFEIDGKYAFLPIEYTRELFEYGDVVTALELKLSSDVDCELAQKQVEEKLGESFVVQNKQQQHEEFYKMIKIEKWITFLILFFILIIAVVNIIGSLSMLILEKKSDNSTLEKLGATIPFIRQIFLLEGWMISVIGAVFGVIIGITLCLLQEYFGFIKLGNGYDDGTFLVNAYPVSVQFGDVVLILISVLMIGLCTAWIPTHYIQRSSPN